MSAMSTHADRVRDPLERARRAEQILDGAAALLLRHGYRRVTVDDVAAAVGIGKGTVYLHWRTREALFSALIGREALRAMERLVEAVRSDPGIALLHRFAGAYFTAVMERPLLRGFVLGDSDLWGKLVGAAHEAEGGPNRALVVDYVRLLAAHGAIREDMEPESVSYACWAVLEGFLRSETGAEQGGNALAERAALLTRTVEGAFGNGRQLSGEAVGTIAEGALDLFTRMAEADREALGLGRARPGAP